MNLDLLTALFKLPTYFSCFLYVIEIIYGLPCYFSDARNMARDVQNIFMRIFMEIGGKTETEAQKFQEDLERKRCYQTDVWS